MSKVIDINKALSDKRLKDQYNKYAARKQQCINRIVKNGVCECSNCKLQRVLVDDVIYFLYEKTIQYSKITGAELYWADLVETLMLAAAALNANLSSNNKPDPPPSAG